MRDVLYTLRWNFYEANKIINFAFSQDTGGNVICDEIVRSFITDNAFLKIFIAWEGFLETAFIKYLMGEPSISGLTFTRYASPTSIEHAQKILIGTQKYVDWSNPEIVRKISKLYFENGDPFHTIISSIQNAIFDLKTIRNAAAHISSTTQSNLDALATRTLARPVSNIKVSDLLFAVDPNDPNGVNTVLDSYLAVLELAAENIASG